MKLFSYLLSWLPGWVYAQTVGGGLCPSELNGLCTKTLSQIVDNVLDYFLYIGAPIAAVMIVVGGFQIMTAAGDPEKFKKGRETILYAAVGLVVLLMAKSVKGLIFGIFGVS